MTNVALHEVASQALDFHYAVKEAYTTLPLSYSTAIFDSPYVLGHALDMDIPSLQSFLNTFRSKNPDGTPAVILPADFITPKNAPSFEVDPSHVGPIIDATAPFPIFDGLFVPAGPLPDPPASSSSVVAPPASLSSLDDTPMEIDKAAG